MLPEPPADDAAANPFPGLRPFEPDEYHLFFGRDGQSDELLRRLRQKRFVAVIGTSGSGKSSLVRAGLLPSLHGGLMVAAGSRWRVTIFRPGANPIGHLADALSPEDVLAAAGRDPEISRAIIEATLRRGALGLAEAVRQAHLPAGENLLIVVDQFEEIFRFKSTAAAGQTADDAAAFVKLLLEATARRDLPVYVIITMRSDFLGDCAQFRDLPEAINDGQYLIPRMTRDQRREAIAGPVAVGGAEITPRLVNRLLNDVGDNPDQLPILQHALMRTWQQWAHDSRREGPLDLDHYQSIGGMAEALSRHADKAYDELPDGRSKIIAEKLFKLLTERGGDNRETRRPTRLAEIAAVAEASEPEVVAVIDRFRREGRSFLMPPADVRLDADTLVDISHESLIRGWQRLRGWVDDEAQSARTFRRLAETAALHAAGEAGLWRDPDLGIALRWRETTRPNAAWGARYSPDFDAAMEFLEASRRERDAERAERQRQRRKTLRLTQALAAVLLVGFLLSLGLTVYAFRLRAESVRAREAALAQAGIAERERGRADAQRLIAEEQRRVAEDKEREAVEAREKEEAAKRAAEQAALSEKESRLAAERAKDEAQRSAERALRAKREADDERQRAVRYAERASRLANRVLEQDTGTNLLMLAMVDRLAQVATPRERAYWRVVKANALNSFNHTKAAIAELNEALKVEGDDPRALISRSYMYLLSGDREKAVADALKAVKLSPTNAAAYTNLVVGLGTLRRYDEASQSLDESIRSFTHAGYGEYIETDVAADIEKATGQKILFAESDEALTALNYERATLAAARGSGFRAAVEQADKRPPSEHAYLFALNWAWLHHRLNPADYGVLAAQGALWARAGFPAEAAAAYRKFREEHAKRRDPRYEELVRWAEKPSPPPPAPAPAAPSGEAQSDPRWLALSALRAALRGDSTAAGLYKQAAEAAPDNIDIQLKRAQFMFDQNEFDAARAEYARILERAPQNANARIYHALAGLGAKSTVDPDKVRADILAARALDPSVVPHVNHLIAQGEQVARLLAEKKLEDGIDFLERGAKHNLPAPEPYFYMAKLLNDRGAYGRALEKIRIAIDMKGDRLEYHNEMARAEAGLRGAALGPAQPADAAARAAALRHAEIGDAMHKFGNDDSAFDAYHKSLTALDKLAGERGAAGVNCEAGMILRKVGRIAEMRLKGNEPAEFIKAMFGDLKNIEGLVTEEVKRLSGSGRGME